MLIPVLLFIVGLLCLIKGGDWFVDGATGIARRFHVPELLIGATVVSIGTTLPEVMVSTTTKPDILAGLHRAKQPRPTAPAAHRAQKTERKRKGVFAI